MPKATTTDPEDEFDIPFTPVPSRTKRRDGWTEVRQRGFIRALAQCGSANAAAGKVGMSVRSAHALRLRPGAESFSEAWDVALEIGRELARSHLYDKAMNGGWVPVIRRGRIERFEYRRFDKMALALLSAQRVEIEDNVAERQRRREYRRIIKEQDRERAAEAERIADADRANREAWEAAGRRIAAEGGVRPGVRRPRGEPRILSLFERRACGARNDAAHPSSRGALRRRLRRRSG